MADLPGRVRSPTSRRDLEAGLGPLAGIRVADCSTVLAGPYCTMLLADLGADVIKVEPPDGDATRGWGPPWVGDEADGTRTAAYFLAINRNKRSIRLDLKTDAGREVLRRLLARSDVLVENYRVGGMAALGFGDAALGELNPDLVHLAISGFGTDGPDAAKPGYDFVIQAVGGLMSITGATDEDGGRPTKVGVAISDVVTGLFGAVSILAGLLARDALPRTDIRGQRIDVSLLESTLAVLVNQAQNAFVGGDGAGPDGQRPPQPDAVRDLPHGRRRARGGRRQRAAVAAPVRGHRAARARRGPVVRDQRRPRRPSRRPPPDPRVAVRGPDDGRVGRGARCRRHPVRADQRRHRGVRLAAGRRARDDGRAWSTRCWAPCARSGCRSGCPRRRARSGPRRRCSASTRPRSSPSSGTAHADVATLRDLEVI